MPYTARKGVNEMRQMHKCCAGIDVHRMIVVVTIARASADGGSICFETKEFKAFHGELRKFAVWVKECGVEVAVMESTGVYWKPVYEALEESDVVATVVNARHVKNVPGRKTDVSDSKWLAELALHGLLRASFVPPRDFREIRMLTRYRAKLVQIMSAEKNRLHKILDSGGIKLGSVVSSIDGVSATMMIAGLMEGNHQPGKLAKMARGTLAKKIPELKKALEGRMSDRHRFLLRKIQDHIAGLVALISEIDVLVVAALKPYAKEWELVQTVPGFDQIAAAMLLAEIGIDMSCFQNRSRISSWAGLCPGNNQSAGKKRADEPVRAMAL